MPRDHGPVADRVREVLAAQPSCREIPMFGGLSFMVEDSMVVNVRRSGDLLVRVDPERSAELVAGHGAAVAEMGTGRSMGPGWLNVPAENVADDDRLRFWIDVAMEFHARSRA